MTDELVLYTHPMSRGRTVRWMLDEVGQPYRTEVLDYGSTMKSAGYLAINPMGKVPALRHGEALVTEGAAICAYLADAFPAAKLAPDLTSPLRAAYYRWLFFAAGPLEAAATNKALGVVVPPERERMVGYGNMAHVLDLLEGAVSKTPYLLGEDFTAADLFLGSQMGWLMMFGAIEKRPAFQAYWSRMSERPAAIRAKAVDDALIPPRTA